MSKADKKSSNTEYGKMIKKEKKVVSRETSVSSSTSVAENLRKVIRDLKGRRGQSKLNTLSVSFTTSFGIHWSDQRTIRELRQVSRNPDILDEMEKQKVWSTSYLIGVFGGLEGTIRQSQKILVRRGVIKQVLWQGKARRSWPTYFYYTEDATIEDFESLLALYESSDLQRLVDEEKQKKTPEELEEEAAERSYRLSKGMKKGKKRAIAEEIAEKNAKEICEHGYFPGDCDMDVNCKNIKPKYRVRRH